MTKIEKIILSGSSLLVAIDILLKNTSYISYFTFLIKPVLSVNLLEIIILLLLLVSIAYNFLPKKIDRFFLYKRASNFYENWKKFKFILQKYSEINDNALQEDYENIREGLEQDFNFFVPSIHSIQNATHRQHNNSVIQNFERCFTVREIADWQSKVQRQIPAELDCFDYLLIALKEDYKKPERPRAPIASA